MTHPIAELAEINARLEELDELAYALECVHMYTQWDAVPMLTRESKLLKRKVEILTELLADLADARADRPAAQSLQIGR